MKKYYLVRVSLKGRYGSSWGTYRIVAGVSPADAARVCYDDLPDRAKSRATQYPEFFRVWSQLTPEAYHENVGVLQLDDDHDEDTPPPYDAVADMFESTYVDVRL